jgi:hypothetical protein
VVSEDTEGVVIDSAAERGMPHLVYLPGSRDASRWYLATALLLAVNALAQQASDSQVEKRQKKKQLNKSTVRLREPSGIHDSSPTDATASSGEPSGIPRCPPTDDASASSRDPFREVSACNEC